MVLAKLPDCKLYMKDEICAFLHYSTEFFNYDVLSIVITLIDVVALHFELLPTHHSVSYAWCIAYCCILYKLKCVCDSHIELSVLEKCLLALAI